MIYPESDQASAEELRLRTEYTRLYTSYTKRLPAEWGISEQCIRILKFFRERFVRQDVGVLLIDEGLNQFSLNSIYSLEQLQTARDRHELGLAIQYPKVGNPIARISFIPQPYSYLEGDYMLKIIPGNTPDLGRIIPRLPKYPLHEYQYPIWIARSDFSAFWAIEHFLKKDLLMI